MKRGLGRRKVLFFGYGYSASYLVRQLFEEDWNVKATTRNTNCDPVSDLCLINFDDVNESVIEPITHILISIPPQKSGDPVLGRYGYLLRNAPNLQWVGYLSSTGVYGNTDGNLVDEKSSRNPTNDRSKYRVKAENSWLSLCRSSNVPIHIFRLAGIYGLGRNMLMRLISNRVQHIEVPGHRFSRIHVDDLSNMLLASMVRPTPGEIFNVCDDEPASQSDVLKYGCELLKIPVPEAVNLAQGATNLSPRAKEFWRDNKVVDNSKIKKMLGVSLLYPNYREGLKAIFEGGID